MKKVISIDGGGIRGIVSATVLWEVEKIMQDLLVNHVDLVTGTSTGAILSGGIAKGLSMEKMLNLYYEDGPMIFGPSEFEYRLRTVGGLFGGKFDADKLKSALESHFGDMTLGELYCDFLATSYNMTDGAPKFFSKAQEHDVKVVDVISASAAAPTYFNPTVIDGKSLIDGGVVASSPAMCAFAEIKSLHANLTASEITMISVGNGNRSQVNSGRIDRWFKYKWIKPLIDIMMASDAGVVHHQLVQIYGSVGQSDNYLRVNGRLPKSVDVDMGNASRKNMDALTDFADKLVKQNKKKLEKIARKLTV